MKRLPYVIAVLMTFMPVPAMAQDNVSYGLKVPGVDPATICGSSIAAMLARPGQGM